MDTPTLRKLREYLKNTSYEQQLKDWAEVKTHNNMEFTFYIHEKVTIWRRCQHIVEAANKNHAISKMKNIFKEDSDETLESSEYLFDTASFPIERELFDNNDKLLIKELC